jgi:hypothetical protein
MARRGRLRVDGDRVGLRLPSLRGEPADTLDFATLSEEYRQRDIAEEDRVLYVALTRAREVLILSGGEKLVDWPEAKPNCPPIRWLAPALIPALQDHLSAPVSEATGRAGARLRLAVLTRESEHGLLAVPGADPQGSLKINAVSSPPAAVAAQAIELPRVGVPGRLSYTSLSAYGRCGYRYYLQRVMRLPDVDPGEAAASPEAAGGLDPRIRGSIVHSLFEELDLADPVLPDAASVRALADLHDAEIDDRDVTDCLAMVSAFLDGPMAPPLRAARRIRRERGFSFPLDGADGATTLVNGFVDVIAEMPDGASLVLDYKTDQVAPEEDLEERVVADYGVQRAIYGLAALRSGSPRVEVVHLFLHRPHEPVVASFQADDAAPLEEELRTAAEGLLRGDFRPSENPHLSLCGTCPGRASLCWHDQADTGRPEPSPPIFVQPRGG